MMSFKDNISRAFDKFTNAVGGAARSTADKAKTLTDVAKLNLKINAEEDKIKKAQAELGKAYYNDFEAGLPTDAENYLTFCNTIREAKQTIESLRAAIEETKAPKPEPEAEKPAAEAVDAVEEAVEEAVASVEEAVKETVEAAEKMEFTVVDDKPSEEPSENVPQE